MLFPLGEQIGFHRSDSALIARIRRATENVIESLNVARLLRFARRLEKVPMESSVTRGW